MPESVELFIEGQADTICSDLDPGGDARVAEFEALVRAADDGVRVVVYRMVGADVDDVMQTAYLRAFRHWRGFRSEASRPTWLYRVAVNAAFDHLRSQQRRVRLLARAPSAAVTADVAPGVVEAVDLERAVGSLGVDQRVVLLLVDGQGFSHEDAAFVLGVPVGTVSSRLSRARQNVRTALQGAHHE